MKPHTFAQMVNAVRDLVFDFGTSEQFRDRVADLLGKYIPVEHNSKGVPEQSEIEALLVLMPELTNSEKCKATREWFMQPEQRDYNKNDPVVNLAFMAGMDEGYSIAISRLRAIPADRVLGEWKRMDSAPTEPWSEAILADAEGRVGEGVRDGVQWVWRYNEKPAFPKFWMPLPVAPDALRANQGGADHE